MTGKLPTIRCIAIDDEPLALEIIARFCERVGNITLDTYSDSEAGMEAIASNIPTSFFST